MRSCKYCGQETFGKRLCPGCMRKYLNRREATYDQAVSEIGPLSEDTHQAIVKRVKQLEKITPL